MSNEYFILDGHPFADKGMTGNLYPFTNLGTPLNLNEGANFAVVAYFAAIKINEGVNLNIFTQLNIWRDP